MTSKIIGRAASAVVFSAIGVLITACSGGAQEEDESTSSTALTGPPRQDHEVA